MNPFNIAIAAAILTASIIFASFAYFNTDCPDINQKTIDHFQSQQRELSGMYQAMLKETKAENDQLRTTTTSILDALEQIPPDKQAFVELKLQLEEQKKQLLKDRENTRWQGEQAEVERKRFEEAAKALKDKPCDPKVPSAYQDRPGVIQQVRGRPFSVNAGSNPVSGALLPRPAFNIEVQPGVACDGCLEVR